MNRFELQTTASGQLTAMHCGGALVHSAEDPLSEAEAIATLMSKESEKRILLIGNGLGYLSCALRNRGIECTSIELFPELHLYAALESGRGADEVCVSAKEFSEALSSCISGTELIIAPYVIALRGELKLELRRIIDELHVKLQSQRVYKTLIDFNIATNRMLLSSLPQLETDAEKSRKHAVVAGSGPTLEACIRTVAEYRENILLFAASGAVPVLARHGLNADWIIALEARDTILPDLEHAPDNCSILIFPWTHPQVVNNTRFRRIVATEDHRLFTNSGSTGLAALDFAAKLTEGTMFMIGMDMSDRRGEYSRGVERETANSTIGAVKFGVMRTAAASWIRQHSSRKVFHMVMPGDDQVEGAYKLYPIELTTAFARERSIVTELVGLHA